MDKPFAHGGDGEIKCAEQGAFSFAAQGFIQFQIAAGGCIQGHEFVQAVGAQGVEQVQCVGLSLFEIEHDCPRRSNGKAVGFEPKTVQCGGFELCEQGFIAFARFKFPRWQCG